MTIASEITRINNNIASAYTACNNKGATMPQIQNSANLATCISSISGGGGGSTLFQNVPLGNYFILDETTATEYGEPWGEIFNDLQAKEEEFTGGSYSDSYFICRTYCGQVTNIDYADGSSSVDDFEITNFKTYPYDIEHGVFNSPLSLTQGSMYVAIPEDVITFEVTNKTANISNTIGSTGVIIPTLDLTGISSCIFPLFLSGDGTRKEYLPNQYAFNVTDITVSQIDSIAGDELLFYIGADQLEINDSAPIDFFDYTGNLPDTDILVTIEGLYITNTDVITAIYGWAN